MRAKPKDYKYDDVPGPGKYEIESSITRDGKHINSSIKNNILLHKTLKNMSHTVFV